MPFWDAFPLSRLKKEVEMGGRHEKKIVYPLEGLEGHSLPPFAAAAAAECVFLFQFFLKK